MCLIAFAWKIKDHKLVLAANRDEFFKRPTRQAMFWEDGDILGGLDLEQGGTWLAISKKGRFVALTNYRDPAHMKPDAPSRGQIVRKYIEEKMSPAEFIDKHLHNAHEYNGFNLMMMDGDKMYYYSNIEGKLKELEPGIYALSNALLDTPWPKTQKVTDALTSFLSDDNNQLDNLQSLMCDTTLAADSELPSTGMPFEIEKSLSSIFIRLPQYGTRCTTLLQIDGNDHVHFKELTYNEQGKHSSTAQFEFELNNR